MEKNREVCVPWPGTRMKKWCLMTKLSLFLCLVFQMQLSARGVAQTERMDISVNGVSIETLIKQIKTRTQVDFLYNIREIEQKGTVSLQLKNATVMQILDEAFKNKSLTYSVVNGVFVITPGLSGKEAELFVIRGKVVDDKGEPLPGVTVRLDSTKIGTATDVKGMFILSLPVDRGTLVFSFIGYQTVKMKFKYEKDKAYIVKMKESISSLDEVTVVAYGETTKRESTGSISTVKADDIKGLPTPSISNLLQGRVAGMDVTNVTGAPGGGGTQVTIRGYNSLSVENGRRYSNPLWVVDGVPMNTFTSPVTGTNGLSDLNPETIESIQVLKDASATSLYGSRAANGVIIVTTKKGRKNQDAQFDVNFSYSYSFLPEFPTIYGGKGERDYRLKALRNYRLAQDGSVDGTYALVYPKTYQEAWDWGSGSGALDMFWANGFATATDNNLQDSLNSFYNNSTNFFKYYFQSGKVINANVQTSGGSERMTYSVGLGYYDEKGILKNTGYNRVNLMGNFNFNPVERLSVDFRTYLSYSDRSRGKPESGTGHDNVEIEVIPGNPVKMSTLLPGSTDVVKDALSKLQAVIEKNTTYRLRSSFGLGIDIMKGLKLTGTLSLDYAQNNRNNFAPSSQNSLKESLSQGEIAREMTVLNEDLLTYKLNFKENHNLDVMLGFSYQYDESNYLGGWGKNGPSDLVQYVTAGGWPSYVKRKNGQIDVLKDYSSNFTQKKMASYFGRLNYNYKQKYMLTATLRRDGSSVFGRDNRWATFPSFALAWNFSEEDFMKWIPGLDFGKIRASWGVSGNQFNSPYLAYGILTGGGNYQGEPSLIPNWKEGYYNPDLGWEETAQYDAGIDLNFMNYRLEVTFDYYNRKTKDLLYRISLPGSHSGYYQQWRNAADLENQGVELEVKYDIFRDQQVKWNISMNLAKNWNKFKGSWNGRDLENMNGDSFIIGKSVGGIYGHKTKGFIQSEDEVKYFYNREKAYSALAPASRPEAFFTAGDLNIVDINGDGKISEADNQYLGSSIPQLYGGVVNELRWKNFDLNMLWSFSIGRDMINGLPIKSLSTIGSVMAGPIFEDLNKVTFWEKKGDRTDYPRLMADNYNGTWSTAYTDRNVERVSYLKLKTLTVGYSVPLRGKTKFFIKDIRLFFSGENLLTLTNYSGMDPETVDINTGYDDGRNYPLSRKLTFGVTIKL